MPARVNAPRLLDVCEIYDVVDNPPHADHEGAKTK